MPSGNESFISINKNKPLKTCTNMTTQQKKSPASMIVLHNYNRKFMRLSRPYKKQQKIVQSAKVLINERLHIQLQLQQIKATQL